MRVVVLSCRCYNEQHIFDFEQVLYNEFKSKFHHSVNTKSNKCYWECKFYVENTNIQNMIDCSYNLKATHIEIQMEDCNEE